MDIRLLHLSVLCLMHVKSNKIMQCRLHDCSKLCIQSSEGYTACSMIQLEWRGSAFKMRTFFFYWTCGFHVSCGKCDADILAASGKMNLIAMEWLVHNRMLLKRRNEFSYSTKRILNQIHYCVHYWDTMELDMILFLWRNEFHTVSKTILNQIQYCIYYWG
jgi:hypothetical protein